MFQLEVLLRFLKENGYNYSLKEIAEKAGYSDTFLYEVKNERAGRLHWNTADKLAVKLGYPPVVIWHDWPEKCLEEEAQRERSALEQKEKAKIRAQQRRDRIAYLERKRQIKNQKLREKRARLKAANS